MAHCSTTAKRTADATSSRDRMIWTAHEVLRSGGSVFLDLGCWAIHERYAIRSIAETAGASFDLWYPSGPGQAVAGPASRGCASATGASLRIRRIASQTMPAAASR